MFQPKEEDRTYCDFCGTECVIRWFCNGYCKDCGAGVFCRDVRCPQYLLTLRLTEMRHRAEIQHIEGVNRGICSGACQPKGWKLSAKDELLEFLRVGDEA